MQDFWLPTHGCISLVTLRRSGVQNAIANPGAGGTKPSSLSCCMTTETGSAKFQSREILRLHLPQMSSPLDFASHLPSLLFSLCLCPHYSSCLECCSPVPLYPSSKQATSHSSFLPSHGSHRSSCLPLTFKTARVIQMPSEFTVVLCTFLWLYPAHERG